MPEFVLAESAILCPVAFIKASSFILLSPFKIVLDFGDGFCFGIIAQFAGIGLFALILAGGIFGDFATIVLVWAGSTFRGVFKHIVTYGTKPLLIWFILTVFCLIISALFKFT